LLAFKVSCRVHTITPQSSFNPNQGVSQCPVFPFPNPGSATGDTAEIYDHIKKAVGNVPNTFAAIGAHGPAALRAVLAARRPYSRRGRLPKTRSRKRSNSSSAASRAGDYCVAAHTLLGKFAGLKPEVLKHIRDGEPTGDAKRDALIRFVRSLAEDKRHRQR